MTVKIKKSKGYLYKSHYDIIINNKVEGELYSYNDVTWTVICPVLCIDEEKYGVFEWIEEDIKNLIELRLLSERYEKFISGTEETIKKLS